MHMSFIIGIRSVGPLVESQKISTFGKNAISLVRDLLVQFLIMSRSFNIEWPIIQKIWAINNCPFGLCPTELQLLSRFQVHPERVVGQHSGLNQQIRIEKSTIVCIERFSQICLLWGQSGKKAGFLTLRKSPNLKYHPSGVLKKISCRYLP